MAIEYRVGDVLESSVPAGTAKIIPHICNDMGGWGSGFVVALSKKWKEPEAAYRHWYNLGETRVLSNKVPFDLGRVQYVKVADKLLVANMIGQHETIRPGYIPIRYAALVRCLEDVRDIALKFNSVEIHAPKFGAGLAGGDWHVIETLINEIWIASGLKVVIFTLE